MDQIPGMNDITALVRDTKLTDPTARANDMVRIKKNVAKMAAQNAPEEEIDGYIASEGVTVDDVRDFKMASYTEDAARSTGTGLRRAAEGAAGLLGDVRDLSEGASAWTMRKLGVSDERIEEAKKNTRKFNPLIAALPNTADVQKATTELVGEHRTPQTTVGEYFQTSGEFAPALLSPGSALRKLGLWAAPTISSETAGQATKGTAWEPYARIAGALAAPLTLAGGRRMITPFPTSPERQQLVDALRREGVDVTAGQATGRKKLQYAESELGGQTGADFIERQGEQFTQAALRRAGINAERATPDVMDQAFARIGGEFDALGARNTLVPDRQFATDLADTVRDYTNLVPQSQQAQGVTDIIVDIAQGARGGILGDRYQALRSRLERMARATKDPQLMAALRGIREALDDAMDRSIAANNPADIGAWRQTRNQYRNMIVLEDAAAGAAEHMAEGLITPAKLAQSTKSKHGKRNYVRGRGDFSELARAGQGILKPLPNSGTAPRINARNLGGNAASLAGGGAGWMAGDPMLAIAGLLAGQMAPGAVGRTILSGPGRAYLGNQLMAGPGGGRQATTAAAIAALLAAQGNQARLPPP
jgi:hypothetical protein